MKKLTAILLILCMLLSMTVSCASQPDLAETKPAETEEKKTEEMKTEEKKTEEKKTEEMKETEEKKPEPAAPQVPTQVWDESHPLHGKKVLFVGNSYTYYGNAVINRAATIRQLSLRQNDRGYFYQLCKAKGANVSVTNWTFGNHGIGDLFESCTITKSCSAGYKHVNDLTDAAYDYVFLQERSGEEYTVDQVVGYARTAVDFFRAANPNVKIFYFAQSRLYQWNVNWLPALDQISAMGVTVIRWGKLVEDVIAGRTQVPGATQTYNRNSFIINQSASDGYHPNMLTGYLTSLMAYCAITGESAVGQPYAFATDSNVNPAFSLATYISKYYKNGAKTNMKEIFASPADMAGLQTLADQYK